MLTTCPDNARATTTRRVYDITEPEPIPRGTVVSLEDYDPCGGENGLWVVE